MLIVGLLAICLLFTVLSLRVWMPHWQRRRAEKAVRVQQEREANRRLKESYDNMMAAKQRLDEATDKLQEALDFEKTLTQVNTNTGSEVN